MKLTQPKTKKRRRIWLTVTAATLLIGGTVYGLADRYLIEHVEVVVAQPAKAATTAAGRSQSGSATAALDATSDASTATASGSTATTTTATAAVSDDWSYKSGTLSISIRKVVTGSGSDRITYYAADVRTTDPAQLLTAFAKNEFGRNITQATSTIATAHNAIFAINGDYYGFRNDGIVIRNAVLYRDEPAREGLALYSDGTMASYNETDTTGEALLQQGVLNTFSFGPALVKNGQPVQNLSGVKIDTNLGNRSISSANPRTGIGLIAPNHYVFVVVDGRQTDSRGMTLDEFAKLFQELGAKEAYNLDGGGSSTMYFNGRVVNNPQGKEQERGVSDIIFFGEE